MKTRTKRIIIIVALICWIIIAPLIALQICPTDYDTVLHAINRYFTAFGLNLIFTLAFAIIAYVVKDSIKAIRMWINEETDNV